MIASKMSQVLVGLLLILIGLVFGVLKNRMLNSAEKSGSKIFKAENRPMIELRIWIVVVMCIGLGLWLLFDFLR